MALLSLQTNKGSDSTTYFQRSSCAVAASSLRAVHLFLLPLHFCWCNLSSFFVWFDDICRHSQLLCFSFSYNKNHSRCLCKHRRHHQCLCGWGRSTAPEYVQSRNRAAQIGWIFMVRWLRVTDEMLRGYQIVSSCRVSKKAETTAN